MIFAKNSAKQDKVFYSLGNTFRQTNIVFRKSKPHSDIEVNGLPSFRSASNKNEQQKEESNKNMPGKITEVSCTNFMKNYIDKLKKERKRQNKKHQSLKTSKPTTPGIGSDHLPLYNMTKPNQLFILQKVNNVGQKNFMNTISVVSQDLYDINTAVSKERKEKRLRTPENSWVNRQKISEIIKQIRNSKKKNSAVEQLVELDSLQEEKEGLQTNFPKIQKHSRQLGTRKEQKRHRQANSFNLKGLEPWKQEGNFPQFGIEQYSAK